MKIKEAVIIAGKEIEYLNAKILIEYLLNVDANYIIVHGGDILNKYDEERYFTYVSKVKSGKPLQYITNKQEFMGENFYVDENVLIPQPDTEILVENTIKLVQTTFKKLTEIKILDLCTGSGAIAVSIKKYLNLLNVNSKIYASDISKSALKIAKKNVKNILKDDNAIDFIESNMFENIKEKFDIIVSNPPYIKSSAISTLPKDVQNEPNIALNGGEDGLDFYRIINENVNEYLNKNAYLLMEIGYDQGNVVKSMFDNSILLKDYSGNDRIVVLKK